MTTEPLVLNASATFGPVSMHEIAKKRVVIVPADIIRKLGWTDTDSVRFTVQIVEGGALLYKPVSSEI